MGSQPQLIPRAELDDERRRRRLRLAAAFVLVGCGSVLLGGAAWSVLRVELAQQRDLGLLASAVVPPGAPETLARPAPPPLPGELLGRLTIPARGVDTSIREGVADDVLDEAAGHLPGTALPGGAGNSAIAAHRDQLFSGLRSVVVGDLVHLETPTGRSSYRVTDLSVVEPNDLSMLAPTDDPALTLITCYPFNYVGPAPRRFVVRATRVGDRPPAALE